MSLRLPDSGAEVTPDGRRHAPSAARNAAPILDVLRRELPVRGRLLEIASGTGQHAAAFAAALPGIDLQPTDVNPENLPSIAAWATAANQRPPVVLDAAQPGWASVWHPLDAVLVVNLLHLIPVAAVAVLLDEAGAALGPGGVLLIYGPFLRDGRATSDGDAAFDASLRAQDPRIGYKDVAAVTGQLQAQGLTVTCQAMPANNLMLVARKAG
jgi:SAM-dependent methyltransferase